jgi:hypothetical protein
MLLKLGAVWLVALVLFMEGADVRARGSAGGAAFGRRGAARARRHSEPGARPRCHGPA